MQHCNKVIILLVWLSSSGFLNAQSITAKISNARINSSEFLWDVEVRCDGDWGGGNLNILGNCDLYFTLNELAFGFTLPTVQILQVELNSSNYQISTGRVSDFQCWINITLDPFGGGANFIPPLNEWATLFTVSLPIINADENSMLFWDETATGFSHFDNQPIEKIFLGDGDIPLTQSLAKFKVFLEGPYNTSTHQMNTTLNDNGLLPLISPYGEDPRTVDTIPTDIVDWVLVELREMATGPTVSSKSVFLRKDGYLVADDGIATDITLYAPDGNYYVVIKHRNHLAVMSTNTISLNAMTATLYDFTSSASQCYGAEGVRAIEPGVWGAWTGDADGTGFINSVDLNSCWRPDNGLGGYKRSDFDLSGFVNSVDLNRYWRINNGRGTSVN
ncbi:hypothetical protein KAR48_16075 [bacterium]|nr:hypothetical protein [bacterium]